MHIFTHIYIYIVIYLFGRGPGGGGRQRATTKRSPFLVLWVPAASPESGG